MIILSKPGYDHIDMGINRQDVAFVTGDNKILFGHEKKSDQEQVLSLMASPIKFVLDGCGSTPHSEVGAALFAQYFSTYPERVDPENFEEVAKNVMHVLANGIIPSDRFRRDDLSFTILACMETEEQFVVKSCGDGFIIAIRHNGEILTYQLNDSVKIGGDEYPNYLIYNYIENRESLLGPHRQEICFSTTLFPKEEFARVGVATDGLRFVDNLDALETTRWNDALLGDKGKKLSVIINRNHIKFKDDISICI